MTLDYCTRQLDLNAWASQLGISREAIDMFVAADSIDLHVESFLWTRICNYTLDKRHGEGLWGAAFYSQVDLPRVMESGLSGSVWSIATNPFRRRARRTPTLMSNLQRLRHTVETHGAYFAIVRDAAEYRACRAAGRHGVWLAIQGGNALSNGASDLALLPHRLVSRITLVHLTNSRLGSTSSPLGALWGRGLSTAGAELVCAMNDARILVDLAHISEAGFWSALEVHDPSLPAMVSHTGVRGVHDCWRNLSDKQVKAIADTGGVIGIIFHNYFLGGSFFTGDAAALVDHMEHVINVAGEDVVALGSDWDGLIVTPRDMRTVLELPVLVQRMLDRGWSTARIHKLLGRNYLRMLEQIRPAPAGGAASSSCEEIR